MAKTGGIPTICDNFTPIYSRTINPVELWLNLEVIGVQTNLVLLDRQLIVVYHTKSPTNIPSREKNIHYLKGGGRDSKCDPILFF